MMQTVAAESQSQALSVDGAAPRDGDVVRTVGHEQCHIELSFRTSDVFFHPLSGSL